MGARITHPVDGLLEESLRRLQGTVRDRAGHCRREPAAGANHTGPLASPAWHRNNDRNRIAGREGLLESLIQPTVQLAA